ncbi:hypothetical protein E2C01_021751 [Portunus trituberculatus]|uniref:Uncharacterized protein n=1 Tax=Portunus trituberculatus TaxID=210409 RepID=A0A5B7E3D8_PORTR|nr:hypothetical protein [Portunus trituberculatus]
MFILHCCAETGDLAPETHRRLTHLTLPAKILIKADSLPLCKPPLIHLLLHYLLPALARRIAFSSFVPPPTLSHFISSSSSPSASSSSFTRPRN